VSAIWPLRAALAEKLSRKKIAPSLVHRVLARHGPRKVAPDMRNPKSDLAAQAERPPKTLGHVDTGVFDAKRGKEPVPTGSQWRIRL